jgi:uncharacterized membrane protein YkoI
METQMTLSLIRKSMIALVAVSGLAAAPALANGYPDEDGVIFADREFQQVREFPRRPPHPPVVEHDWNQDEDFISPRQISRMLRHQGYVQITEISLRGDQYRVIAIRRNGAIVKLRLDAYEGNVLSVRRVGWAPRREEFRPHRQIEPGLTIEFGFDSRR